MKVNNFGKWIKITDQLPPEPKLGENKDYLVTTDNGLVLVFSYHKTMVRKKEVLRWEWHNRLTPWKVVAWMEFPEPFVE